MESVIRRIQYFLNTLQTPISNALKPGSFSAVYAAICIYDPLEAQLTGLYSTAISICHIDMYLGTI